MQGHENRRAVGVNQVSSPHATHSSDSDTLATFVTNYRMENGRRYHAYQDGTYWGPNDEQANEGQDLTHEMYSITLNGLHLAPLHNPQHILDVGTGTGIWAIEMADAYPEATVEGTDLSPIQPELVPPNCIFEIDDVNLEWTWPDQRFDYVHVREMLGSIKDWARFLSEALRCTRPGGWIEVVEHSTWPESDDGSIAPNHFFNVWGRTIQDLGVRWGKTFDVWKNSKCLVEQAGFVDVVERKFSWPINSWPAYVLPEDPRLAQLGRLNHLRMQENLEAFTLRILTGTAGWTPERAHVFMAEMRMAIKDTSVHAYLPVTVVYGRKPG